MNPQTLTSNEQPKKNSSGVTVGVAVGAVLGTVAFCAIAFVLLWWFYLRGPRNVRKRDPNGGREAGDFDLLRSEHGSRTNSMQSRERVYANNPYIASAAQRPRPETQTFSELTLPVPLAVPSDFQQSSYSGTPFSPSFPHAPGGMSAMIVICCYISDSSCYRLAKWNQRHGAVRSSFGYFFTCTSFCCSICPATARRRKRIIDT